MVSLQLCLTMARLPIEGEKIHGVRFLLIVTILILSAKIRVSSDNFSKFSDFPLVLRRLKLVFVVLAPWSLKAISFDFHVWKLFLLWNWYDAFSAHHFVVKLGKLTLLWINLGFLSSYCLVMRLTRTTVNVIYIFEEEYDVVCRLGVLKKQKTLFPTVVLKCFNWSLGFPSVVSPSSFLHHFRFVGPHPWDFMAFSLTLMMVDELHLS